MSINVTVNGNRLNIRRGRMVLSDLDQIKKNERDRRRRLRLEQVRQQSKEISDRLLERTKNIAREEFKKLENDSKLKEVYNGKIMEVQQKYQEDMADIGQAHISAALEPDHDTLIKERDKRNMLVALKRGQDAMKQVKDAQQKETLQQQHQEHLREVREVENLRSAMIASLPKRIVPEEETICVSVRNRINKEDERDKVAKKNVKRISGKKSPGKITKSYIKIVGNDFKTHSQNAKSKQKTKETGTEHISISDQQSVPKPIKESSVKNTVHSTETENNTEIPRKEVMKTPIQVDKSVRYNPEDYVQSTSETANSRTESSSSFSDDSSYFSDSEQYINKDTYKTRTPRYVKCPGSEKVQLYDHGKRQKNAYDQPVGVVEKIHTWNEPSAMDIAQEIKRTQAVESQLSESRKENAQKRGEDAALREKVRRDYQMLIQDLEHLASEERKLKASQVERYPAEVYVREERRKTLRDQHKQKLNRAMKTLLDKQCSIECSSRAHLVERQITLTPIEREKKTADTYATWEEPYCFTQGSEISKHSEAMSKESETSREEQILDMLKKVERQKRLLLREFGADLPDDVFNVSIKPLFEREKSVETQTTVCQDTQKLPSPEIKVINASREKENSKKDKIIEKPDSLVKKVEIAVQTTIEKESEVVQDKGTQVELIREKETKAPVNNEKEETIRHYPIEPKVVIIRQEVESSDTSSETLGEVTDPGKPTPKVTPKKKTYSVKTKQTPSRKSSSTRTSKTSSPAKKLSKFSPKPRYSSPKKTTSTEDVPCSKKIKMYVDKNGLNIKVKPPEVAEVLVDVSTQSAQVYSTDTREQCTVSQSKQQWIQSKSKRIKIKDISDTSTSFASPPPIRPRDIMEALSNNISILEMLDSSANESIKLLKRDVSPVSTPETPSPRTMRMPSNIPHPDRIKRLLLYTSTESQTNDYTTASSIKNDYSTSTDSSEYQQNDRLSSMDRTKQRSNGPVPLEFCLCHNPDCRQAHARFEEIRNYALKNCPQILQKYEDLQHTCAERIMSLTNLIEKVRNEQRGMELSIIDPSDETSLMQLPPTRVETNDLEAVHRIVENIEAIHNQLARTLIESQRIIKNKSVVAEETDRMKETDKATSTSNDVSKKAIYPVEERVQTEKARAKPRIISEERVDIQLDRFKMHRTLPAVVTSTPERDISASPKPSEDEMIERLSKEILEQSKGLTSNAITAKEIYSSAMNHSIQTSTDNNDLVNADISKVQQNFAVSRKHSNKEKSKDFVPLLDGIPKVPKGIDNNGRSKPPVSLLSGPYSAEIESPGHELSTIIEFDTPDTVSKIQNNIRSPLSARKIAEMQIKKSTPIVKPSEHITSSQKLREATISRTSAAMQKEASIFLDSPKTSKNVGESEVSLREENDENEDVVQEMSDKKLQCDTDDREPTKTEEPFYSASTDPNRERKDNKDKITSTSSNSFSELSGVSQIASTPSSTLLKYTSSPEEMETALKKLGLGWAITTLKKTREASALSSSSNSDVTPINTAKRISPVKKPLDNNYGLLDFSDVSSISIKEASKSTEQAVLLRGRTSTPKIPNSNSNSEETNTSNNSETLRGADGLIIPNVSLTKTKSNVKKLENL